MGARVFFFNAFTGTTTDEQERNRQPTKRADHPSRIAAQCISGDSAGNRRGQRENIGQIRGTPETALANGNHDPFADNRIG